MTKEINVAEQINIVEPAFPVALYELEKLIKAGYSLSQTREPIFIAGLFDIVLVKGEEEVVFEEPVTKRSHTVVEKAEDGAVTIRNATIEEIKEGEELKERLKQQEINEALDKADAEDAAKHPEEKPVVKRGPKPKAK